MNCIVNKIIATCLHLTDLSLTFFSSLETRPKHTTADMTEKEALKTLHQYTLLVIAKLILFTRIVQQIASYVKWKRN